MTAPKSMDPVQFLREQAASADPDVLRAMVKTFADALMSAEADAICGAPYGQRSDERTNHRNGYRPREWDTRAGTVELAIPKLAMWRVKSVPPARVIGRLTGAGRRLRKLVVCPVGLQVFPRPHADGL